MRQHVRFCTAADGVRIAFARTGSGPALVRAANWFTHLDLDGRSTVWRHWFETLGARRTLVRYDPRGCGLSDRDVDELGQARWVADLECVVDAAGLNRFALIGLCQGGAIAAAYAAMHPERVSRLVLYDSYPFGAYAADVPARLTHEARTLSGLIDMGWGKENSAFHTLFASLLMPGAEPEMLRRIVEMQRRSASAGNARRIWDAFHGFDIRALAPRITAPTLVFHGRKDAMVPFEAGRHLASLIPGARFVPLETANHILRPDEPAWTVFREELEAFLEPETGAAAPGGPALDVLTARETQILDSVARGLSNAEIGALLRISEKTVRNHLTAVFAKLGLATRAQAIVLARDSGLGRN